MKSHYVVLRYFLIAASVFLYGNFLSGQSTPAATPTVAGSELVSTPKQTAPSSEKLLTNYVETGGQYLSLTNGFGNWAGGYVRGVLSTGSEIVNGEVDGQREFNDAGTYFAVGDNHNFSADTYASITLGSSAGGFFFPRFRADAFLNQKWLGRKQLIVTLGLGYYAAKDPHRDHSVSLGTTYYFDKPWIFEDGVRFNLSNPGRVFSPSGFVALTQGRNKHRYVIVRVGYGQEGYQLIGPTAVLTSFRSRTATVTWRQWIGTNWGANAVADYYSSPFYTRAGASLGLFREF